jgi:hypothetical protein
VVRGHPLRAVLRVLQQRNAIPAEETKQKAPVTYQVSEQPSSRVQEEDFAKQLRLARYLAAGGSPPSRLVELAPEAKSSKRGRPIAKAGAKTKAGRQAKKPREEELAKERRRAARSGQKGAPSGPSRGEKQWPERGR